MERTTSATDTGGNYDDQSDGGDGGGCGLVTTCFTTNYNDERYHEDATVGRVPKTTIKGDRVSMMMMMMMIATIMP